MSKKQQEPRVLLFDIETAPMSAHVWTLWKNDVALNQIVADWHILSWSAKWLHDSADKIMYADQRDAKNVEDDSKLLKGIWKLLDEADVVITQNGRDFDQKKLYARFILTGMSPPSSFKHIDTLQIAKRNFAFSSNRLEYLSSRLGSKYKKLTKRKFAGHELWKECLAGNLDAWKEMELYNKQDVLALEEVYRRLQPWDSSGVNFSWYSDSNKHVCQCGSTKSQKRGYSFTMAGKFQRFQCQECGAWSRDRENLFSKKKRASLRASTT